MPLEPKTEMQVYSHATNNNAQFARGFLIGASTGAVVFLVALSGAYSFDVGGIHPLVDSILDKIIR